MNKYNKIIIGILSLAGFAGVAFFATSDLSRTPPIWMDEGIIVQVSKNMARHGVHGIQVAPGEIVSAGFVSTGYPATFPVSLPLRIFDSYSHGYGLFFARSAMVAFILSLSVLVYFFVRKTQSSRMAVASLFLIASFAPVYGHGKNILGEIPGLVYLFASILVCAYIEKKKPQGFLPYIFFGLFLGLTIATKPIFILLGPAFIISVFLYRKKLGLSKKNITVFFVGLIVPLVTWLCVQFSGDSFATMFGIYANPHNNDVWTAIFANLKRFVTEMQPLYTLGLLGVWLVSLVKRLKQKHPIAFSETLLFIFSAFVMLAFLRTVGYYRYFFLAEFIALVYLPQSLMVLRPAKIPKIVPQAILVLLIIFQLYQTQFHSFVSESKTSRRHYELKTFATYDIPKDKSIFIYQAPELVIFMDSDNYYQYMDVTTSIHVGTQSLPILLSGKADMVFTLRDVYEAHPDLFTHYGNPKNVDRYTALSLIK